MVARLLRVITFGGLLLATLCVWTGARAGHALLGWAGAISIALAHAMVLAAEFGLLYLHQRGSAVRSATPRELLRAWCGEARAAFVVFCWRQPFHSRRWTDTSTSHATGRRGVVLVHGYLCNRGLWNRWLARLSTHDVPMIAVDLEPILAPIDDYASIIDDAVQSLRSRTGERPVIVAHSMGGLAVRCWMAATAAKGEEAPVHHVVTIGTPHKGTWLARYGLTRNARQMRTDSQWIAALAAVESPSVGNQFTCYYSHCDNIVFPASGATLPGADNKHLRGRGHVEMLDEPEPWRELLGLLGRNDIAA